MDGWIGIKAVLSTVLLRAIKNSGVENRMWFNVWHAIPFDLRLNADFFTYLTHGNSSLYTNHIIILIVYPALETRYVLLK